MATGGCRRWWVASIFASVGVCEPALAEWEYTDWSMTSAEVVGASGGRAKVRDPPKVINENYELGATGSHAWDEHSFQSFFFFDRLTGYLAVVELKLIDGSPDTVLVELKARHGPPTNLGGWGQGEFGVQGIETFVDAEDENLVKFNRVDNEISVSYMPGLGND